MKRYLITVAVILGAYAGTAAWAGSDEGNGHERRMVPVLVNVDTQGNVTRAEPGIKLRPNIEQMVRQTLDTIINKPAMKDGHPVSSQFIANLAIDEVPQGDGTYSLKCSYVSSKPVPAGHWHWVHQQSGKLALSPDDNWSNSAPTWTEWHNTERTPLTGSSGQ